MENRYRFVKGHLTNDNQIRWSEGAAEQEERARLLFGANLVVIGTIG